ncbi:RNA-guided endonuclease TnpB family protein, partial [Limnoraphis robusta Tam1]
QVIIAENLNVKGMVRNHNLAKAISDCGWGMFLNFVDYKAKRDGKTFLEIYRFFPSSKTCNVCLNVVESLPLDIRQWECNNCHAQHDRDINAAINIRDEGLRVIAGRINCAGDPRRQPRSLWDGGDCQWRRCKTKSSQLSELASERTKTSQRA